MSENHVETGANKRGKGVNTPSLDYNSVVSAVFLIRRLKDKHLQEYMPLTDDIYLNNALLLLLAIDKHPCKIVTRLREITGISEDTVRLGLRYLVAQGYVRTSSHARLVHVFGAYMFDVTYLITKSGRKLLRDIWDNLINKPA